MVTVPLVARVSRPKFTEKYKSKLQENVKKMLDEVEVIQEWEDEIYGERDLNEVEGGKEISSEDLQRVADRLNAILHKEPDNKEVERVKKN